MKYSLNRRFWRNICCAALFLLCALICMHQTPVLAEETYPFVEVKSDYKEAYWQEFVYSDRMLLADSTADVNPEVAKVAVSLAAGAYRTDDINSMLEQMGFSSENFQFYERNINYNDLVAYTIGTRKIPGTSKTAVIVGIRGSAQNAEWFSNFNVGAGRSDDADLFDPGDHLGFHLAASNVWDSLVSVLSTIEYEDRIVLLTGHSRGAAVANILSAWLNEGYLVPQTQLWGYTYACPNVSRNIEKEPYPNIHNFNITGDMVPSIPLRKWGYGRHGYTHNIIAPEKLYQTVVGRAYTGASVTTHYEDAFEAIAPTAESLEDPTREFMLMTVAYLMGGHGDVKMEEVAIKYLTDHRSFLAKKYFTEVVINEMTDVKDAFEAGKKHAEATLKVVYQLQAETEGMTPEEFEEHRERNLEAYSEIMGTTGVLIETLGDFPEVISILLNAIQYADEAGTVAGALIFGSEEAGEDGNILQSILDAHLEPVYICGINEKYFGYQGRIHSSADIALTGDILTVGARCFEGSAITEFDGNQVEYISDSCFADACQLKELVIPDTIVHIGSNAFTGTFGLEHITLPIEWSRVHLFNGGCTNVKTIEYTAQSDGVMPERSDHQYADNKYEYTLEYACRGSLEKIVYNEGVVEIADFAAFPGYSGSSTLQEISLPSTLKKIGVRAFSRTALPSPMLSENVEELGGYAFAECAGMTSVTIPASVTTMGGGVFMGCDALKDIVFHNTRIEAECFAGCDGLETLTIPNHIVYIGYRAFDSCTGLKNITMPIEQSWFHTFTGCSNVKQITYTAQSSGVMKDRTEGQYDDTHYQYTLEYACRSSLETVIYEEGITSIGDFACFPGNNFSGSRLTEIRLPSTLKRIGIRAFSRTALPSPMLPENVEELGNYAFAQCQSMASVAVPASVTTMGSGVFMNGSAIRDIEFRNALIGAECFAGCDGLETLTIPNRIVSIGYRAFDSCTGLKNITMPIEQSWFHAFTGCSNVKQITYTAQSSGVMKDRTEGQYDDTHYQYTLEYACRSSLEKVIYEEGVTSIGNFACFPGNNFSGGRLTEIRLPSTLKRIGIRAFSRTALPSPMLPENVEELGSYAFAQCLSMTSVAIPASVTTMGSGVFTDCDALRDIVFHNTSIETECFAGCDGLETLTIPNNIDFIGYHAFDACTGLKNITMPIEQSWFNTFTGCRSVEQITYTAQSSGVMKDRTEGYYDDTHYQYTLEYACRSSLKKVIYEEGVTSIGNFACFPGSDFSSSQLTEIRLPSTLKRIGLRAFSRTALPSPMLSENVEELGSYAFAQCQSMTSVTIPASVTTMGSGVFMECSAIRDIEFRNALIGAECFAGCTSLETLVIPNQVASIYKGAFNRCTGLKDVTMPIEQSWFSLFDGCSNVKRIEYTVQSNGVMPGRTAGNYDNTRYQNTLEYQCRGTVEKLVFNEGVTTIANYAHMQSSVLSEVVFPSTLREIGLRAFENCPNLSMISLGEKVEKIDPTAFNQSSMKVVCIEDSYAYNWAVGKGYWALCCCSTPETVLLQAELPTCTQTGLSEGWMCESCGETLVAQEITPAAGHAVTLGAACYETTQGESISVPFVLSCGGVCGLDVHWRDFSGLSGVAENAVEYPAELPGGGLMQVWIGEDEAQAAGCTVIVHAADQLILPSHAAEVASEAFAGVAAAEVILPEGMVSIGSRAFAQCEGLALVTIPDTVKWIAEDAFEETDGVVVLCSENSFAADYAQHKGLVWLVP